MNAWPLLVLGLVAAAVMVSGVFALLTSPGRPDADDPHGPRLASVRRAGLLGALLALLLSGAGGLRSVAGMGHPADGVFAIRDGVSAQPWVPSSADAPLMIVLTGPVLVALVWVNLQWSLPGQRGARRRADPTSRASPVAGASGPLWAVAGLGLAAGALLLVLAGEPGVPAVTVHPEDPEASAAGHVPVLPGAQLAGWLLVALVAVLAALAVGLWSLRRRRAVAGLTPAEDGAARTVAAHRLARTVAWMVWGVIDAAAICLQRIHDGRVSLGRVVPDHPAALPASAADPWIAGLLTDGGLAALVVGLVLLAWRPPAGARALLAGRPPTTPGTAAWA